MHKPSKKETSPLSVKWGFLKRLRFYNGWSSEHSPNLVSIVAVYQMFLQIIEPDASLFTLDRLNIPASQMWMRLLLRIQLCKCIWVSLLTCSSYWWVHDLMQVGNNKGWGCVPTNDNVFDVKHFWCFSGFSIKSFKAFKSSPSRQRKRNIRIWIRVHERSLGKFDQYFTLVQTLFSPETCTSILQFLPES